MRDHAHTLSDFLVPTLSIECEPCGRRGRYNVARLMEKYGDAKLPELLHVLADCPKAKSFSFRDRYRVQYCKDSRSSTPGTGQRAIMLAIAYPEPDKGGRGHIKPLQIAEVDSGLLSRARAICKWACPKPPIGTLRARPRLSLVERPGFFAWASVGPPTKASTGVAGIELGASPSYSRRPSISCLRGFWDLGAHGFVRLFHRLTTDTFANALEG